MNQQDFEKLEAAINMQSFGQLFTPDDYEQFKKVFKERGFKKGQKILWRGQKGFFFFIIGAGKISVRVTGEDKKEKIVTYLGPGDFVGEISLLYNRPRVADCYAEEDNTLLFLLASRPFFDVFVAKPEVRTALEDIAQSRMAQTKKISTEATEPGEIPSGLDDMVADIPSVEPALIKEIPAMEPEEHTAPSGPEPEIAIDLPPLMPYTAEPLPEQEDLPAPLTAEEPFAVKLPPSPAEETLLMPEEGIIFPEEEPVLLTEEAQPAEPAAQGEPALDKALKNLFCHNDEKLLAALRGFFREKNLKKGEPVSSRGGDTFVLIREGEMLVRDRVLGNEVIIPGGNHFGELSLLFPLGSRFECSASRDSSLYVIDTPDSLTAFLEFPGVREELEVKALRRVWGSLFRHLSIEPEVVNFLKSRFKEYAVSFSAQ
jgi:CRP-like cAMP-binding protein